MGPMEHTFYKYLDVYLPQNTRKTVLKKILIDQTLGAPLFICSFFYLCNAWHNKSKESIDEIKAKFIDVYKVGTEITQVYKVHIRYGILMHDYF